MAKIQRRMERVKRTTTVRLGTRWCSGASGSAESWRVLESAVVVGVRAV